MPACAAWKLSCASLLQTHTCICLEFREVIFHMKRTCCVHFSSITDSLIDFGEKKAEIVPYSKVVAQINALAICSAAIDKQLVFLKQGGTPTRN